ncbi:MAG: endonuclease/exonuclease/phosphatase family protein [Cyclobacteriaceae bacterium]|nr:endonuclease/exonuclease/phosphatase family protein [Cyclobacteriaceae bacterium]
MIILIIQRKKIALLSLFTLLVGWPFLQSALTFNKEFPKNNSIRVLSFNTKFFKQSGTYSKFSIEMIQWVTNDTSDIKCLQEYSTNPLQEPLDVTGQMTQKGYTGFTYLAKVGDWDNNPGMAIFSKFSILDSGIVFNDKRTHNAAIFADLDIHGEKIRVYNVHLASMSLDLYENPGLAKFLFIIKKIKYGALKRSDQIKELIAHTRTSPYPYIICGDFNETPYSYAYQQLKKEYENTFEQTGNGFGFTFNDLPYLLRIDHQFHSFDVHAIGHKVNRRMNISDHFPTYGYYVKP